MLTRRPEYSRHCQQASRLTRVLRMRQVSRMDCAVWLVTFLGCLFVSIDAGLGAGIGLGLLLLFTRTAFARIGAQAPLPGAAPSYRDADLYNLQVGAARNPVLVCSVLVACLGGLRSAKRCWRLCKPTHVAPILEVVVLPNTQAQCDRTPRCCCCAQGDAEAQLEGTPAVIRLSGPLCFANAARLKEHLLELVVSAAQLAYNTLCMLSGVCWVHPNLEVCCMHKRTARPGHWCCMMLV